MFIARAINQAESAALELFWLAVSCTWESLEVPLSILVIGLVIVVNGSTGFEEGFQGILDAG